MIHFAQRNSAPSGRTGSQLIYDNGTNILMLFADGRSRNHRNDPARLDLPTLARAKRCDSPFAASRGPLTPSAVGNSLPVIGKTFHL